MHNGFVKLRRGLEEHLEADKLSYLEVGLYVRLMMKANYETGVVYVTTKELATVSNSPEQIRKILDRLEEKKYIKTFRRRGSKNKFAILINKHCRFHDGSMLNAFESLSPDDLKWGVDDDSSKTVPSEFQVSSISEGQVTENAALNSGEEVRSKEVKNSEKEEESMSAFKDRIGQLSWKYLKVSVSPKDDSFGDLLARARIIGQDVVLDAYEKFCSDRAGESVPYPLRVFMKVADGYVEREEIQSKSEDQVKPLVMELSAIADGSGIVFDKKRQMGLASLLETNSPEDIKAAFKEFYSNLEDTSFARGQAAKTFVETAEQVIFLQARRRAKEKQTQELLRASTESEQRRAAEELAARMKADDELDALIEDSLPQ